MKKRKKIELSLNKRVISNLTLDRLTGGSSISRGCTPNESLQGGCGTDGPVPSGRPACNDK